MRAAGGETRSDPFLLHSFPAIPHGVHWSLERPRELLGTVGDPQERYLCLHVGGTNGKGSVAAAWTSVLRALGLRVGLYTSPHLCSFRERIQVDGIPISDGSVQEGVDALRPAIERLQPSFFEAATALAFLHFARSEVDVAVIEVGLGGRLDATNVIRPVLSAVTNIAMDHAEYLGDSLQNIAREKAGIIKPHVPIVTAERNPGLRRILWECAEAREAPFHWFDDRRQLGDLHVSPEGTLATLSVEPWGQLRLRIPLLGVHQAVNVGLAVQALAFLPDELRPAGETVVKGVENLRWPGRVQVVPLGGRTWVFDVAHNVAGVRALAETLPHLSLRRPVVVLAGILGDKDWQEMLPPLFQLADAAVLTQPTSAPPERRWNPSDVARSVGTALQPEVVMDFEEALTRACALAGEGTVVVTGSCHTVGDALLALDIVPFQQEAMLPLFDGSA
jgi:dihydrofolate synthase/folylpolyglutamate synthase